MVFNYICKGNDLLTHCLENYMVNNNYFLKFAIVFRMTDMPSLPSRYDALSYHILSAFGTLRLGDFFALSSETSKDLFCSPIMWRTIISIYRKQLRNIRGLSNRRTWHLIAHIAKIYLPFCRFI